VSVLNDGVDVQSSYSPEYGCALIILRTPCAAIAYLVALAAVVHNVVILSSAVVAKDGNRSVAIRFIRMMDISTVLRSYGV